MLFIIAVVLVSVLGQVCDVSKNDPVTGINEDCNYAGTCVASFVPGGASSSTCDCCAPAEQEPGNSCVEHWKCDPNDPFPKCFAFDGTRCEMRIKYNYIGFGFRGLDQKNYSDVTCLTNPEERYFNRTFDFSTVDFTPQVAYVLKTLNNWTGLIQRAHCDTCTPRFPCVTGVDVEKNVTDGNVYGFQADFNEFYNINCSTGSILYSNTQQKSCPDNYDFGQLAYIKWKEARRSLAGSYFIDAVNDELEYDLGWESTLMQFYKEEVDKENIDSEIIIPTESPTQTPTLSPTKMPTPEPTNMPTPEPTNMPTPEPTNMPTPEPTPSPTNSPTTSPTTIPTPSPTNSPTESPTFVCEPYVNDVDDLELMYTGKDCRGGLNSSYPGGFSCDSPYLICLPQENTPAQFGGVDYKASDHRYSADECKQECANDQRCSGIEYHGETGECVLIDDIPVVGRDGDNNTAECYEKRNYCNPHFEADDLSNQMLDCYCPNNRKGSYTKKVKRIVENTRFCGNDTEVDTRIRKAQANRMFHLCENWCLFLTEDPAAESWYYDPWNTCWREQYPGDSDTHRSYCSRVIINPDTIEMQFLDRRVELACNATN